MKRKASNFLGSSSPAKLKKESTNRTIDQTLTSLKKNDSVKKAPLQPAKWPSFGQRQRKAPSWLSSYVTNPAQEKEMKKEKSKPKLLPFPTLVPPSKQKEASVKQSKDDKPTGTSLLRRQSTLKLQSPPSSPDAPSVNRKPKGVTKPQPSLSRKSTEILSSTDSSSNDSFQTKYSSSARKISVLKKDATVDKIVPHKSETKSKLKKPVSSVSKRHQSDKVNGSPNGLTSVVEICDKEHSKDFDDHILSTKASKPKPVISAKPKVQSTFNVLRADTIPIPEQTRPNMLEVVICISTSGALRDYLAVLQDRIREMIWRLQSLVPNLRIGVMAHTQGGIHDDQTRASCGSGDHNYNRVGGHGGTKWLDLGATLSQICAFVDSLEPEPTLYPDYVQDNLEMALWKLQRCMSWSSCSYRTVIMIGRGRPNRTLFYTQKEHWRHWIRSALELKSNSEIPVIDWELEAKLLAEMGIHVFTVQGANDSTKPAEEDEGTRFFRRVAELTQGQHVRVSDPSRLVEIILGVCCACHGPELLSDHRDTVRDDNDGMLPSQLTEVFVSLQLHSKCSSLAALPSLLGNLDIAGMRQRLTHSQSSIMECSDEEEESMEMEDERYSLPMEISQTAEERKKPLEKRSKANGTDLKKVRGVKRAGEKNPRGKNEKPMGVKGGGVKKSGAVKSSHASKKVKQAVKAITKGKLVNGSPKGSVGRKNHKEGSDRHGKGNASQSSSTKAQRRRNESPSKPNDDSKALKLKRKGRDSSDRFTALSEKKRGRPRGTSLEKAGKTKNGAAVLKAKAALKLKAKAAKTNLAGKKGRGRPPKENVPSKSKSQQQKSAGDKNKGAKQRTPQKNAARTNAKKPADKGKDKRSLPKKRNSLIASKRKDVKVLTKKKPSSRR